MSSELIEAVRAGDLDKARALGGSVLLPPQTLPEGDAMALFRDPEGIPVALWKPRG